MSKKSVKNFLNYDLYGIVKDTNLKYLAWYIFTRCKYFLRKVSKWFEIQKCKISQMNSNFFLFFNYNSDFKEP